MKRITLYIVIAVLAVFLLVRFFLSTESRQSASDATVVVSRVVQEDVAVTAQTIGTVEAYSSVEVKSMVTGPLLEIEFKEGDVVSKDQVLFKLDLRPFQAALAQAQANLARNQAMLAKDEVLLKRHSSLVKKGYTSKQDYDTLIANAKSFAAMVKADEAAVEHARLQLEYAIIRAPIAGKTGKITLKPGSVVKANDTFPLVVINQVKPVYVTFTLPQAALPSIQTQMKQGEPVVNAVINPDLTEKGKLVFVDNTINTATGTIQLKAEFDNQDERLWPGQHVTVELPLEMRKKTILVPSLALMTSQKGFYVYVVDDQNKIRTQWVVPGPVVRQRTIIESGLKQGERVVIAGQLRLQDGMKVSTSSQ